MKKLFFLLFCMVTIHANATILVVKEYGVNATYSSINAALAAAQNNDTIVVYDKPSGQAWIEDLTIDKNLTFLHPTQGTRFKVPGQIYVVPKAGMDLYFIGWDLNGKSITATATGATATLTNRAKVTVTDCINVANVDLRVDGIDARVFYNQTNITGSIYFRHGLSVANVLSGGIYVDQEGAADSQNDSIIIIGNKARWCYVDTKESGLIANNYFNNDNGHPDWGTYAGQGNTLLVKGRNTSLSAVFGIYNNTITNIGGNLCGNCNGYTRTAIAIRGYANTKIVNNIIYSQGGNCNVIRSLLDIGGGTGTPFISYNYLGSASSDGNCGSYNSYSSFSYNNEYNIQSAAINGFGSIDTWGRAASGNTTLINGGSYLGEYYDIDLSRNDIGTYGGPYSIDNYISSGTGKGKVLYINIKHQLTNLNQILDVKASGGSKF